MPTMLTEAALLLPGSLKVHFYFYSFICFIGLNAGHSLEERDNVDPRLHWFRELG